MAFELLRETLARQLGLDPSDVSLVGSSRLGFSLSPRHPLRPFCPGESDLDLFVVSESLRQRLKAEYFEGEKFWKSGAVSITEGRCKTLQGNTQVVRNSLKRGYIDTNKVPVFAPDYVPRKTLDCALILRQIDESLEQLDTVPRLAPTRSVRVYSTWDAAMKQNITNMQRFFAELSGSNTIEAQEPAG